MGQQTWQQKYRPFVDVPITNRQWPGRRITQAPIWCSVDLRDGNQALINPMDRERKLRLWHMLVRMGYKQIEVGFPSASQTDFDFVRHVIESDLIPPDVTIQVLTPCREDLIVRTFEAVHGARRSIIHFYNSTSPRQRQDVFQTDRAGTVELAANAAKTIHHLAQKAHQENPAISIDYEYSPESFSQTEGDFAVEICAAVADCLQASAENPVILNLPATVEVATPNHHADQIEWFIANFPNASRAIISVHPHNDRGCAVAAAELALLAGAQRIEGTLFGNGERTGNVDLVTLGLNLASQGIDPGIDFSDLPAIAQACEHCNQLPIPARHPYAGSLVFTAFSGSHQDAIRKGLAARKAANDPIWDVPYLPIDPADVHARYEEVIRINSQSGKGGVAFVMETDYGLQLPRPFQIALSKRVQEHTDRQGTEILSADIYRIFCQHFVEHRQPVEFLRYHTTEQENRHRQIRAWVRLDGNEKEISATGNGPIDAYYQALSQLLLPYLAQQTLTLTDYLEHAIHPRYQQGRESSQATAAAYVSLQDTNAAQFHGAGLNSSIVEASLHAVTVAFNSAIACQRHSGGDISTS